MLHLRHRATSPLSVCVFTAGGLIGTLRHAVAAQDCSHKVCSDRKNTFYTVHINLGRREIAQLQLHKTPLSLQTVSYSRGLSNRFEGKKQIQHGWAFSCRQDLQQWVCLVKYLLIWGEKSDLVWCRSGCRRCTGGSQDSSVYHQHRALPATKKQHRMKRTAFEPAPNISFIGDS